MIPTAYEKTKRESETLTCTKCGEQVPRGEAILVRGAAYHEACAFDECDRC